MSIFSVSSNAKHMKASSDSMLCFCQNLISRPAADIKRGNSMKRLSLVLSITFVVLTFVGAGYVLFRQGNANAGYAAVLMVFALASILFCKRKK